MTTAASLLGRSPVNIPPQNENRQNSDTQKNISITSVKNTNINRPSCFCGLKNQMINLWHRFIHCIINKHASSMTTLKPSFISYIKDEGNDFSKDISVVNKKENGLSIINKENLIRKSNELLSASKYTEQYLKILLNEAPSALIILATNTELEEKTCDDAHAPIFFQGEKFKKYGDINILSVKTSNTQNIGRLAIDNYNITLGGDKVVTSIPVIHVVNWLDVSYLNEDDKQNLLGHITETINNRKKLSLPQSGYERKLPEPKKELFALSFKSNKADTFFESFSVINKVI